MTLCWMLDVLACACMFTLLINMVFELFFAMLVVSSLGMCRQYWPDDYESI